MLISVVFWSYTKLKSYNRDHCGFVFYNGTVPTILQMLVGSKGVQRKIRIYWTTVFILCIKVKQIKETSLEQKK